MLLPVSFLYTPVDPADDFVFKIDTTLPGNSDEYSFALSFIYNQRAFKIYWGDDTNNIIQVGPNFIEHTYDTPGIYEIRCVGNVSRFPVGNRYNPNYPDSVNPSPDLTKIIEISQFGRYFKIDYGGVFYQCNINFSATDSPILIGNISSMFVESGTCSGSINHWDTSKVTNMSYMFSYGSSFDLDVSEWNTSNVTDMSYLIAASSINLDITTWDTSKVTNMSAMFASNEVFNQPIGNWNTSNVTDMSYMFSAAVSFNQDISNWDASYCFDTNSMFLNATAFNNGGQPMPLNDIFSYPGKDTSSMFAGCVSFNQNINGIINASGLLGSPANYMFDGCIAFNNGGQSLNPLEIYGDAQYMFSGCTSFNQNVGQINFSSGFADGLFYGCTAFNNGGSPDINDSAVFDIPSINDMFYGCTAFNQSLQNWIFYNDFSPYSAIGFMGDKTPTTYPSTTYDALLNGWYNGNGVLPFGVEISFGTAQYSAAGQPGRDGLINDYGWIITDGGLA